jgi:hypothetical protein
MKLKHILFAVAILALSSCTENARAKNFGGTSNVKLPAKTKLINATWKEGGNIWILTRPMRQDETPETFTLSEKSNFGLVEGAVNFIESK